MDLITLTELNVYTNTNLSADYGTDYLQGIITAVSDHVIAYCLGTLFEVTVVTNERAESYVHGLTGELKVRLRHIPVVSVTSVKYRVGATDTTIDVDDLDLDKVDGYIHLRWYGPTWRMREAWTTVTTYTAGHSSVPVAVKRATALLVLESVNADVAAGTSLGYPVKSYRIGNYAETLSTVAAERGDLGLGTLSSTQAANLLRKYRRPGVV